MSETAELTLPPPAAQPASAPPAKPPRAKPVAAPANGWRPLGEAPKDAGKHPAPYDGSFVFLQGDPGRGEWYFYQTRQFRKGCWQHIAWWRMRFGENSPPKFVPTAWRPVAEGIAT